MPFDFSQKNRTILATRVATSQIGFSNLDSETKRDPAPPSCQFPGSVLLSVRDVLSPCARGKRDSARLEKKEEERRKVANYEVSLTVLANFI